MIKNYFLTQATPFVGRKNELADVHARLLDPACRLLTVTGLGGSGKTRLAVEAAHAASAHFRDGVVFVNLQPLARSDLLVATIAGAAGFTFYGKDEPETQLLNYLREKSLLLLLDNFEHLPDGAMLISAMLAHAPEVRILTTSREPLNLQEEWLYPLQGMSTPPSIYSTSLEDYEAVQLFLFHARRIQPGFDATREREAIIQICRLTEGLPLAIELVATWLSGLTASQVAAEMQQNLDFLSTRSRNIEERHRSIRAVFDQSWKFLSDAECQTFASLSVFRGGFDSQAAEKVAGATLATLSALVEKSLLRTGGSGRFDMHELVRQYGEEQLDHSGLATVTRQAHSTYYLDFLSRLASDLKTVRQREALDAISLNFENVQAAWEWGVQTRQIQPLTAAVDSLFTFYELQSRLHEGDELLAAAAEALPGAPALRSRLLAHQASLKISLGQYEPARKLLNESVAIAQSSGGLAYSLNLLARTMCYLGDYAEAERLCQRSFSLYEELADDRGKARCLHVSGFILSRVGNIREAQERYREAVTLFRALGDTYFLNASLINLGVMHYTLSEYSQARLILEESLDIASQIGNRLEIARALDHLGMLMVWGIKDYELAESYYEQSLSLRREIGDVPGIAHVLNNMADVAAKRNDFARAHRLYSEALTLFQRQGDPWHTASALAGLGDAEAGLGQYDSALEYFRAALQKTVEIQAKVMTLAMFYSVALLFTKMGKKDLAIALTGLIVHHPDSPPGLKDMARESVTATFPGIAPDDAAQMGVAVHRHLRELARMLMLPQTYLNDLASIFADFLSEPLTRRELDILQLMAAGLTNPQIAAHLVISPGTVKTHTLNIYRKLDVANRTQAIARAREFNLLQS